MLGVVYVGVAVPLLELYGEREATLATDRLLEPRLRATAAEVPQLQARLAELQRGATTRKLALDGATDALAAANLQSRIEGLAAAAGVAIATTDGLPAEARGEYRRIGLRMSVSGAYEGIIKLLAAIEAAGPPLVVDNLQIHGKPLAPGATAPSSFDAAFAVFGLRRSDAPGAAKS